jgi:hypothetical protein
MSDEITIEQLEKVLTEEEMALFQVGSKDAYEDPRSDSE